MPVGRNKVNAAGARVVTVVVVALLASGCGPDPSTARGTAERFLDAHFVAIDLRAARELTAALARQKIEQEIALVGEQRIDATTRMPVVHYKLLSEEPQGDAAVQFAYLGQIAVPDADRLERRWLVTVRRDGAGWRVTNYEEVAP